MKREDIDVMEAKARAALEDLPEDVRAVRWEVDASCRDVSASNPDAEDIQRWDIVKPVHGGVKPSTLEHIAASDPHAVLALIAELRRVEQERDVYAEAIRQRNRLDKAYLDALATPPHERIPYTDAGADLLQKVAKEDAPPTDGFVANATEPKPDDT